MKILSLGVIVKEFFMCVCHVVAYFHVNLVHFSCIFYHVFGHVVFYVVFFRISCHLVHA